MPYIKPDQRPPLDEVVRALPRIGSPGELNYLLTRILIKYIKDKNVIGEVTYTNCNEAVGVLGCVGLELYRRVVAPYEDEKIIENGDLIDNQK